jgi:hypothetical protein
VDLEAAAAQLDVSFSEFMATAGAEEIRIPVAVTQSTTIEELFVKIAITKVSTYVWCVCGCVFVFVFFNLLL